MSNATFTVTAEIDATELFENENVNWKFCIQEATFSHREACEFVLHYGEREDDDPPYGERYAERMREAGCTDEFVQAFLDAGRAGAVRVLFYA